MTLKALRWARKKGFHTEREVMAESLRQSYATNRRLAGIWFTLLIIAFLAMK